jgi:predicted oxidoreductase
MNEAVSTALPGRPVNIEGPVSRLAWGMWRLAGPLAAARTLAEAAVESGMTLFDTADVYGATFGEAEAILGQVYREAPALRGQTFLATKGGITRASPPYNSTTAGLVAACEASLKRLGVDVIDLYYIHRPDLLAHPAEAAAALTRLKRDGKIRYAGVSNYTPSQLDALQSYLDFPLVSTQPEFSPLTYDALHDGQLDQAMRLGLLVLAWSPLAGGRLAAPSDDPKVQAVTAALDAIAARQGADRTAVALAWVLAHPSRPCAIVGSQNAARIRAATSALKIEITRADWYDVLVAARGERMP